MAAETLTPFEPHEIRSILRDTPPQERDATREIIRCMNELITMPKEEKAPS